MSVENNTSTTYSDAEYWKGRWDVKDIGFHKFDKHPLLIKHLATLLGGETSAKIFFPFCGKNVDMAWLASEGHEIVGVEYVEQAILEFFQEQSIKYTVKNLNNFKLFISEDNRIKIYNGDFFMFTPEYEGKFDHIWDRGAYGALPLELRKKYAEVMKNLLGQNLSYLIETFFYNPSLWPGPPHTVPLDEFEKTFGSTCRVAQLDEVEGNAAAFKSSSDEEKVKIVLHHLTNF